MKTINKIGLFLVIFSLSFSIFIIFSYILSPSNSLGVGSSILIKNYELKYKYDDNIQNIIKSCKNETNKMFKIDCVQRMVVQDYNYIRFPPIVQEPKKLLEKGGNCRSYTELYCLIYNQMDLKCEPIVIPPGDDIVPHEFALVYDNNITCFVDQRTRGCW